MKESRKEYFQKYYQNNKDKYQKKTNSNKSKNKVKFIDGLKIEHKKVIITFD
jgi:hypothetical protein